jgi:hypothetical protein
MRVKRNLQHRWNWLLPLLLLSGCGSGDSVSRSSASGQIPADFANLEFSSPPVVHHDDGGRVQVELSSAWNDDGRLVVRATFSPDDEGFHLYGSELPMTGAMGVGRPTLIEVSDVENVGKVGPVIADKAPVSHLEETLNVTLPLYPDGPVTLYLPLQFQTTPAGPTKLPVQVTYMSCSGARCNVPVERVVTEISVPPPSPAP